MQRGQITKKGPSWYLRVRQSNVEDGGATRKQVWHKLARVDDRHRSKKDVQHLAERILSNLNAGGSGSESGLTLAEFIENHFLPHVEEKKKPSTHKFYREAYLNHLKKRVGKILVRDFTTRHAQDVLDGLDKKLSHQSVLRIKTAMSAVFTYARQRDVIRHANPVQGSKAEGKRTKPERYAYTLDEVKEMLKVLPEPARTVVATAAFTGLRSGELRGLRWEDFAGEELNVCRSVWRTHVGAAKTEGSADAVPVIPLLRDMLADHRQRFPALDRAYIFAGEKKGFALHLDNLSRRIIVPLLGDKWHGWHGFRRGLATNLYTLSVAPKVIQKILRHANVSTTQTSYVIIDSAASRSAMSELASAIKSKMDAA